MGPDTPVRVLGLLDRPSTTGLVVAALAVTAGWVLHLRNPNVGMPAVDPTEDDQRPEPLDDGALESPAVVALLTNGFTTPDTAITATAIDLASRHWIRFVTVDGELAVEIASDADDGDSLRPHEQQVLNHLGAVAYNGIVSAGTLARSRHRLDRRWRRRFRRSVAAESARAHLSSRRHDLADLAPSSVAAVVGAATWWWAVGNGTEVAVTDSWTSRGLWAATGIALGVLVRSIVCRASGSAQKPTDLGRERAVAWLGYRARLRERIPPRASVLGAPSQQRALATAAVMGAADHVLRQVPLVAEDSRTAWSDAGGSQHRVRVRYPCRPGYGQHPVKVAAAGLIGFVLFASVRRYLGAVADGDSARGLLDRIPDHSDLVTTAAGVLATVCWAPIALSVWAVIAGAIDSFTTRERLGAVVRVRHPSAVIARPVRTVTRPFVDRDRTRAFLAVDDGTRSRIVAWMTNEHTAAPQGTQARVRATPLLGYVRSSEPVGTATRVRH